MAKRNIQDSTISVIEKNEEISKGRTESEAIEEGVRNRTEVSVLQNNSNESDNSSIQTQDQHKVPADLNNTKKPVTEKCVLESGTVEDKLVINHQQISTNALDTACDEKLSCETESPVPNQHDSKMKSEQETATSAKESVSESSPTDGKMKQQNRNV